MCSYIDLILIGTHDVQNLTQLVNNLSVAYSEDSCAAGALLLLVNMSIDYEIVDSIFLALSRNSSLDYTLPLQLHQGQYQVFVYDIGSDGTLASGVGYPAVNREIIINETTQGRSLNYIVLVVKF